MVLVILLVTALVMLLVAQLIDLMSVTLSVTLIVILLMTLLLLLWQSSASDSASARATSYRVRQSRDSASDSNPRQSSPRQPSLRQSSPRKSSPRQSSPRQSSPKHFSSSASDSASVSPECRAIRRHFSSLAKAIADPLGLSMELFSIEIIEKVTMEKAKLPNQTDREKNSILLSAVMRRVEARPSLFHDFIDLLKESEDHILRELGGKLETTYSQCLKHFTPDTKEQTSSVTKQVPHSHSPPTQQMKHPPVEQIHSPPPPPTEQVDCSPPPPATHPSLLSLPPQSPVRCYADYLRAFYQTSELPGSKKWPPSPSKTFINLAVISREEVNRKDLEKFTLATLHGGVDQIINIKAPIEIREILSPQVGKTLQCVLVEGAPGVGKTTLAWEASKQWGKGKLFQQFAIVMLLRLRDQTVQNAQSISDLIFYRRNREEISQYLEGIKGKNTLVILEGLDELPTHLLTQTSIFSDLLSGEELPHATILITSRPSATAHIWNKWKHRISRHIEVLGFTDKNITEYIASVLSPQEICGFQDYLSINPHIRTIMYIPLHAAIVIEVYRMCQDSSRTLPTTITELYTHFVQTVLLRYITSQPDYKEEKVDLNKLTNLPPTVYDLFYNLARLAYNGVIKQQLIFKHQQHTIHHLGFMDAVTELFPSQLAVTYSYNFLHLSIQEYLAAYYVSTMETPQQEQLLQRMCAETHLQNMGRFLAGITKFAGMDKTIVKKTIEEECKATVKIQVDYERVGYEQPVHLSPHALHLLYESGDASILDSNPCCGCPLTDNNPHFDFSTLGYCITHSNCKWSLQLGIFAQPMKSPERIEMLVGALKPLNSNSSYTYYIKHIQCSYGDPECVEQLLAMPKNVLQQLQSLSLIGNYGMRQLAGNCPLLPQCVAEVIPTMGNLDILWFIGVTGATAVHRTVQGLVSTNTLNQLGLVYCDIDYECLTTLCQWLHTSSQLEELHISLPSLNAIEIISTALTTNSTLVELGLQGSKLNLPAMEAMCSMLIHNNTITTVKLRDCDIDDDIISCLAETLHNNNSITVLDISYNSISDRGAVCVAEMLKINNTLEEVDLLYNVIGIEGQKALQKVLSTKQHIRLNYTEQKEEEEEKEEEEGGGGEGRSRTHDKSTIPLYSHVGID